MCSTAISLVDAVSLPGDVAGVNEDAWGMAGRHAWVIDGATGLGAKLLPGRSDAAWLAAALSDALADAGQSDDPRAQLGMAIRNVGRRFNAERSRAPTGAWDSLRVGPAADRP